MLVCCNFIKFLFNFFPAFFQSGPLDAGTDNGLTFTAPNWPTEPRAAIHRITHNYPAHPAGSFYYPDIPELPAIATFSLVKVFLPKNAH